MTLEHKYKIWRSGQETIFGVFHMDLDSMWNIFGLWDRASAQNFNTNLVSIVVWPGETYCENCLFSHCFQGYHAHFLRKGSQVIKADRFLLFSFSVFPGSQVINMVCFSISPRSQGSNPSQNQMKNMENSRIFSNLSIFWHSWGVSGQREATWRRLLGCPETSWRRLRVS